MGVLKRLTEEYFGETERKEDIIDVPEGVERVDFTDKNGVRHKKGYRVKDGNNTTLRKLITAIIGKRGPECDLNDIDVSNVEDMCKIFHNSDFDGDISGWDVSKVTNMSFMFNMSHFNGDISGWNVSEVRSMGGMFAASKFTGKNGDISKWKVSKVNSMTYMFYYSLFNGDISGWDVKSLKTKMDMFTHSPLENNPPEWYRNRKK